MAVTLTIQHPVADFDAWRPVYERHGAVRAHYGLTGERVYRGADDPNDVCIVMSAPSHADVEAFMADPSLSEAMQHAGVTAPPTISIADH